MAAEEVGGEEGHRPLPSGLCEPVTCEASIYSRVYLCPDIPVWLRKDDPGDLELGEITAEASELVPGQDFTAFFLVSG